LSAAGLRRSIPWLQRTPPPGNDEQARRGRLARGVRSRSAL